MSEYAKCIIPPIPKVHWWSLRVRYQRWRFDKRFTRELIEAMLVPLEPLFSTVPPPDDCILEWFHE